MYIYIYMVYVNIYVDDRALSAPLVCIYIYGVCKYIYWWWCIISSTATAGMNSALKGSMYIYIYVYMCTYLCTCMYVFTCVYIYVHTYGQYGMRSEKQQICIYMYIYTYIYMYIFTHTSVHSMSIALKGSMYVHICVNIYVYMYLHACKWIHTCIRVRIQINYSMKMISTQEFFSRIYVTLDITVCLHKFINM